MKEHTLFYATNRNHIGEQRFSPDSYGKKFSNDGTENLRFGKVTLQLDDNIVQQHLDKCSDRNESKSESLLKAFDSYLVKRAEVSKPKAFEETLDRTVADIHQEEKKLGSEAMFSELREVMTADTDMLIFIHGFNVSWHEAVASAMQLQLMLNRAAPSTGAREVRVMLFSWPSDGLALPFVSYKSDRTEAKGSGYAVGRGVLKLRDYLMRLKSTHSKFPPCNRNIHLLCHSMGNYVLQSALRRIDAFTPGSTLPRLFESIFLCAPDINDSVFEKGAPMVKLNELCHHISIYHNRGDAALHVSDYTKGNPERLGTAGAARPSLLHNKVHQIDCSPIVTGLVEHSYYLWGPVCSDIHQTINGEAFESTSRHRFRHELFSNIWFMK